MTIKQLIYKDCMYVSVHAHFLEALDLVKTVHNILLSAWTDIADIVA